MKNIKNIIEQKNPPEDPNVLWLKDDTLYKSTSKGWVPLNESPSITEHYEDHKSTLTYIGSDGKEHAVITDGSFTPNNDGDIVIADSNNEEHIIVTEENLNEILSNGTVVPITWQELKDKRDNGELIPGSLYRITDYQCTTTQENTQSAGHQFDIVLLALSENKLAEEGWAMEHPTDVYDVTFDDDVTVKCYFYPYGTDMANIVSTENKLGCGFSLDELVFDNEKKTIFIEGYDSSCLEQPITYNYFQNSNLSAWKVWYCLDNDKSRFAWADDSVDEGSPASIKPNSRVDIYTRNLQNDTEYENVQYYAWEDANSISIYTTSETPQIGDSIYGEGKGGVIEDLYMTVSQFTPAHEGTGLPNGRGVIYRLIDEWNNDCPYDFKNIQFVRKLTDGLYDAQGIDTWVYTFSYVVDEVIQDGSLNQNIDNTISSIIRHNRYELNNIVSIDNSYGHVFNSFINCQNITIFDDVENAQFIYCYDFQIDDTLCAIYLNNKKVLTEE